jgi:hypothetical protein
VSLSAKGCAEDDEIFCNAGMNDIHGTHGTACIVKNPFILVGIESYFLRRICKCEIRNDVVDHSSGVVG